MGDTISIKKVLEEIRSVDIHGEPKPFSIQWITLNRQKETGGVIKMLSKAILLNNKGNRKKAPVQGISSPKRKANHAKHRTMNIKEMIGRVEYGNPIKIHPTLIVRFNGKKYIYREQITRTWKYGFRSGCKRSIPKWQCRKASYQGSS